MNGVRKAGRCNFCYRPSDGLIRLTRVRDGAEALYCDACLDRVARRRYPRVDQQRLNHLHQLYQEWDFWQTRDSVYAISNTF